MSDPAFLDGPAVPADESELIDVLKRIDDTEFVRNLFADFAEAIDKVTKEHLERANAHLDALQAEPIEQVAAYVREHEKYLKRRRRSNKFTIGGAVFTLQILKRSLVTTKEQDKELLDIFLNRPRLRRNVRYEPKLDRERISAGARLTRQIVASVGGYIGRRQRTTVKTESMRSAREIETRRYPSVKD